MSRSKVDTSMAVRQAVPDGRTKFIARTNLSGLLDVENIRRGQ